jgi:adenylate cyclase
MKPSGAVSRRGAEGGVERQCPPEFDQRLDTVSGAVEGLVELRRALALDPTFGAAAAEMAWLYWDADDARRQVLGLTWEEVDARMHEALTIAAAAPSPAYHQLSAELLVRQHRSDEALATLRQGLTLDPSDPWTYEGLSQALNFSGRPAEARTYLESAMRVDHGWTEWRHYQAGLSAFGLEDFETAVSHLREIDPASESSWPKFYGLHVLAAALAHLDRLPEAREATGDLRRVLRERREGDANTLTAQRFFVYEREKDALRLLAGLERAGIPRWPSAIARAPGEALEGPDLRRLVLGNQLDGRRTRPSEDTVRVVFHKDGTAERRNGDEIAMGTTWLQGSSLCTAYPRSLASCGPVFRLDVGTDQAGYRHELLFETYQLRPAP